MSYPESIYPKWESADDYDGPDDYASACAAAEYAYDARIREARS